MAMLPPPPTKPITLPWQRDFSGGGKKEEYVKPRTEGSEVSYRKIGLTTVAVTQDLLPGMPLVLKLELIRLWNSILPEPGQPSVQLSKLIRLTAWKKAMHAISRWYRTVYIPWLVASYDSTRANVGWILIPQTTGAEGDNQQLTPKPENDTRGLGEVMHNSNKVRQRCPQGQASPTSNYQFAERQEIQYHAHGLRRWACCQTLCQGCLSWDQREWKAQTLPNQHGEGSQSWIY